MYVNHFFVACDQWIQLDRPSTAAFIKRGKRASLHYACKIILNISQMCQEAYQSAFQ